MKRSLLYPLSVPRNCQKLAMFIIRGLYEIPRTGFKDRGVLKPESVGEHTDAVIAIAEKMYPELKGLTMMLKIHDWAEFLTGDLRTDHLALPHERVSKERKKVRETNAMEMICRELGIYGKEIFALWSEFEEGLTRRSQVAQEIDHVQSILKAQEYERAGETVSAKEFYDYYHDSITESILISKMSAAGITVY